MEEMTMNEQGGKQHKVAERCGALFFRALLAVARLRAHGHDVDGYDDDNYKLIPPDVHIDRAMRHLFKWETGDAEDGDVDEHLVHAACRVLMALEIKLECKDVVDRRRELNLQQLRKEFGYEPAENADCDGSDWNRTV